MSPTRIDRLLLESRNRRDEKLDLSRLDLRALPGRIGDLIQLRELSATRNRLESLPPDIGRLYQLERLLLWRNRLTALPDEIGELESLRELSVSRNQLVSLPDSLGLLDRLQYLDLNGNPLLELPAAIWSLSNLRVLKAIENGLTEIDPRIGQLKWLWKLDLRYNALARLPDSIGELNDLTYLNARHNLLASLPNSICQCEQLSDLVLHDNRIAELPASIGSLHALRRLFLAHNSLSRLPPTIGDLSELETLDLRSNALTELPPEIGRLKKLRTLKLSGNRLRRLPIELGQLDSLESLSIEGNPLEFPPTELCATGTDSILDFLRAELKKSHPATQAAFADRPFSAHAAEHKPLGSPLRRRKPVQSPRHRLRAIRDSAAAQAARLPAWLCTRLSHESALRIGRAGGRIAYRLLKADRRRALGQLTRFMPEAIPLADREGVAHQVFETAALAVAEGINSSTWTPEDFRGRIAMKHEDRLRAALGGWKGVIALSAHMGSWELAPPAVACLADVAPSVIMRDLRNPALNRRARALRRRHGIKVYSTNEPALGYMRALKDGEIVMMLADHDTRKLRGVAVNFFGRPALMPLGPAWLARKTGAAIVPHVILRNPDSPTRHELVWLEPIWPDPALDEDEDHFRMLQSVARAFEEQIRAVPGQWMWMHDRWRYEHDVLVPDDQIDWLRLQTDAAVGSPGNPSSPE